MTSIIIASGPVIVENNKVLLNKHGDDTFWKFCGGRLKDLNEGLREGARREAKEEIGVDLEFENRDPFLMYVKKETPEGSTDVILAHFLAKRVGDIKPGLDIRETQWIDVNALPEDLAPNIKPTLKFFGFIS